MNPPKAGHTQHQGEEPVRPRAAASWNCTSPTASGDLGGINAFGRREKIPRLTEVAELDRITQLPGAGIPLRDC